LVKCDSCSNEAVAIVNSCSPTSDSGVTPTKPRCEECLANIKGVNVVSLLVSPEEFHKRVALLVRNKHGDFVRPGRC